MTGSVHRLPVALLELLIGPDLGGRPACAGLSPMFDDELHNEPATEREARHHQAVTVCRGCPVRAACAAARAELLTTTTTTRRTA